MIIHEPRIIEEDDEICLRAAVRVDSPGIEVPESLWFRFPREYRPYVNDRADAFLTSLITPAMMLGEDLVVEGPVSRRLAWGIREYVTVYHQWWPKKCAAVDVRIAELAGSSRDGGGAVGGTCSGGVDSYYSLWQHMRDHESVPGMHITHPLIINGFNWDVDLERTREFGRVVDTYRPVVERIGMDLFVARHNGQSFTDAAQRTTGKKPPSHEGQVVAAVQALGRFYSRFYLPGGATYHPHDNYPHGWHPVTLPLLSTDDTEMLFDGADATRAEKTVAISTWEETWNTLRVCWRATQFNEQTGLVENCCQCPKCLRTMITLEIAGALSRYRTFPHPLDRGRVRRMHHMSLDEKVFYFDMLDLALARGRKDIARDLRYARNRSRLEAAVRVRILRRPNRGG